MSEFSKAFSELNDQQKAAANAIDGAVLVIAGPGTGKTQLLSLRVANILDKSDSLPENILCLTFTNKAASNMQVRLSKLVGSAAQKVMIKTFHSFAAEVMNLYPDYFWNGAKLSNVPDAVQLEIITDILTALPIDNPLALKFAGKFTSTRDVLDGLKLAKEAGLTPDKLRALLKLNLEYIDIVEPELIDICSERLSYKKLDEFAMQVEDLPLQNTDDLTRPLVALSTVIQESFEAAHSADDGTDKTKNTSAWKTRWVKSIEGVKGMYEERKRNEWWLALADVYDSYRHALHERGYYDFADMIIEVITQLEKNADMRADIQERFQYVLIDEFQDTNAAQLRLAHLVADHPVAEGNPNIMAVGDDDQSIYKFNGAELSNMLGFTRTYPRAQVFVLTDNYRSSQEILDFSSTVIQQATERVTTKHISINKQLIAKNPPKEKGEVLHSSFPTKEHQYHGVAKNIANLRKQSTGSIAVLARGHESLRNIAHALLAQNIPVRYEQQQSILELPLIKQVLYICEIITGLATGEEAVVNTHIPKLLAYEPWRVEPKDLWQLALQNRSSPHWIESLTDAKDQELQNIGHWLLWLSGQSEQLPFSRIIEYIIGLQASEFITSPLRRHYLEADAIDTPYIASLSAVRKLMNLANEFSSHGQATTADFVRLLHVSENNQRTITDESLFVTAENAVELLTVHKAKGLEFDTVYVVDAMESNWRPSIKGRRPPSNLPLRPSGDTYDDYVRLMFVAITRAKQNLVITSYYSDDSGEQAIPSSIIRDVLPARTTEYIKSKQDIEIIEASIKWPRLEGSVEKELLKNILDSYVLSPTGFLDFLDVQKGGPHYFLEKHLLRLPEAQSTRAAFGNATHAALEKAQQLVIDNAFDVHTVYSFFEQSLKEQDLRQNDFERYLDHGTKVLERLFSTYAVELPKEGKPEVKLSVHIQSVPLSGKLDRVDTYADSLVITDYKTGSPLTSFYTRNKTLQTKAWRHRTQLELYALMAAEGINLSNKNITAQMMYVEAESKKELLLTLTPKVSDLQMLRKLIAIVHEKIISLNLPDIRHYNQDFSGTETFIQDLLNESI